MKAIVLVRGNRNFCYGISVKGGVSELLKELSNRFKDVHPKNISIKIRK